MNLVKKVGKWRRATIIGECMVEMAPTGATGAFRMGYAGDTFNTAWYLAGLCTDAELAYFTGIGTDPISDAFKEFAKDAGICTDHVIRRKDRTLGLYLISLESGERSFSYWRSNSAARTLADDPVALGAALADADLIYFSGITLGILEPSARESLLSGIQAVRSGGTLVVFDPNLRPSLWPDAETMTRAIMDACAVCDVVMPSFEDEAIHFSDPSPERTIARYLSAGAASVIVKNGPDPVYYAVGDSVGRVETTPAKQIVDTTAAGDSFNAGFLAALYDGCDTRTAIQRGAKLARHVIGARGALVPPAVMA